MTRFCTRLCSRVVLCWAIVLLASIVIGVSIAALTTRMAPVRPGTSQEFWKVATGGIFGPKDDTLWGGSAYFIDDEWAAYELSHMHGSEVYYLSTTEATSEFDAAVTALKHAHDRGDNNSFVRGYVDWRDDTEYSHDAPALLESIKRAGQKELIEKDIRLLAYAVEGELKFWQRWRRADWYWANVVFEWTFLSGLVLFALWPGIRNLSLLRWGIHVGLLPVLFLLPAYLGYAIYSFTSAGPSGGILYPFLLTWVRGGTITAFDSWVLARLPQILEPLSTPIGSPAVLSGTGMPGQTSALIIGILLAPCPLIISSIYRGWAKRDS